jgi:hypothetical protein
MEIVHCLDLRMNNLICLFVEDRFMTSFGVKKEIIADKEEISLQLSHSSKDYYLRAIIADAFTFLNFLLASCSSFNLSFRLF